MPAGICPYIDKPCREHGCTHYVQLHGTDPQTGERISEFMCIDHARLKVSLEGNKETRQGAAAIESFRNEMVTGQRATAQVLMAASKLQMIGGSNGDVSRIKAETNRPLEAGDASGNHSE